MNELLWSFRYDTSIFIDKAFVGKNCNRIISQNVFGVPERQNYWSDTIEFGWCKNGMDILYVIAEIGEDLLPCGGSRHKVENLTFLLGLCLHT